jgi:hypothetical protein
METEMEEREERAPGQIREALESLPILDDLYLRMQAMNIDLVDAYLSGMENDLLKEYTEIERTPIEMALLVSALSQLWIFGLYELLRTWRQRASDVARFSEGLRALDQSERKGRIAEQKRKLKASVALNGSEVIYWRPYEKAARDEKFAEVIYSAVDQSERLFRRIEALRVSLAKHEMPKEKGSFAMAPGYGRIDNTDGSIYWQVVLQGNEVDIVSRKSIARDCRALLEDRSHVILPRSIQEKILRFPKHAYGTKIVTAVLEDGTVYPQVHVAWSKEVVHVSGHGELPFDARKVVDVRNTANPQ